MEYFKINQPIRYWKTEIPTRTKYSKISGEFESQETAEEALRLQTETIVSELKKDGYQCQPLPFSYEQD